MMPEFQECPSCGSEHLGGPCGMTFAERIRSVQINRSGWETAEKRNYYDAEPINAVFGEDSRERWMDETEGMGGLKLKRDGLYRRGEQGPVRLTEKEVTRALGGTDGDG